jgi:hypothetical protein
LPPRQLCFLPTDPTLLSKVRRRLMRFQLAAFRFVWGTRARVISCTLPSNHLPLEALPWRTALEADQVAALLRDASVLYARLIDSLSPECRDLLQDFPNEGLSFLSDAMAFLQLSEDDASPVVLIIPEPKDSDIYRGVVAAGPRQTPFAQLRRRVFQRVAPINLDQEAAAEEQRDAHEAVWRRGAKRPGSEDVLVVLDDAGPGHLLTAGLSVLKELGARGYPIQYPSEYLLAIEEGGGADVEAVEIQKVESEELHPVQPIVRDVGLEVSKSASPLGVLHDGFTINDGVVHGEIYAGICNRLELGRPVQPAPRIHARLAAPDMELHPVTIKLDFKDVSV